jgi:hypothetical protein
MRINDRFIWGTDRGQEGAPACAMLAAALCVALRAL